MVVRRNAAIIVADVAGYSRMMAEDEAGTHDRLMTILRELVPDTLARYDGRMVKTMGDGVMVEFDNAMAAFNCARCFQTAVADFSAARTPRGLMKFRIGINMGDIIDESGEIFGTSVNVATRLEALAEPGGIALSETVYWAVRNEAEHSFEKLGFLQLKNIPYPVGVYRLAGDGEADTQDQRGGIRVWRDGRDHLPSVVVMPFESLTKEPEQDYFCDGMMLDVTADLSKFSSLTVVSAHSALFYKNKQVNPRTLGEQLGVEYAVWGVVQRSGSKIRLNVEIEDVVTGRKLWADRIKGDMEDVFDLQDALVERLSASLASRLNLVEQQRAVRKETGNLNSYEAFLKGLHDFNGFLAGQESQETLERARQWFERAIELDRDYARPWGWMAYQKVQCWLHGWSDEAAISEALSMARHAVMLDPNDHDTHWALGSVLFNTGAFDEARLEYQKALAINPNDADLHAEMAEMLSFAGEHMEAVSRVRFAMHVNPHFPEWYRWVLGWCYYFMGEYEEAIAEIDRISNPTEEAILIEAASQAQLAFKHRASGNEAKAACAQKSAGLFMKKFLAKRPGWTVERQKPLARLGKDKDLEHWLEGLRRAGLPEN